MIVAHDQGSEKILKKYFNNVPATLPDFTIKLFCNGITPATDDTAADFTEASGGGYAAKTLTEGSFTVALDAGDGVYYASYAAQVFTFTGALTTNPNIYGYYILDGDGDIVYSEVAPAVFTPALNGDTLIIIPKIKLGAGTPS